MGIALEAAQAEAMSGTTYSYNPVSFGEEPVRVRLQASLAEIAGIIFHQLNEIATQAINSPTGKDFQAFRKHAIPSYVRLSTALSNTVLAKLSDLDLRGLLEATFREMKEEFASTGPSYFGNDAYQEILFSVSTLSSAHRWLPSLASKEVDERFRARDAELVRGFGSTAHWAQFHLECLTLALRRSEPMNQEVLQELLDGLRSSVMAYGYVREALDLREIPADRYSEPLDGQWDAEDEALANAE